MFNQEAGVTQTACDKTLFLDYVFSYAYVITYIKDL